MGRCVPLVWLENFTPEALVKYAINPTGIFKRPDDELLAEAEEAIWTYGRRGTHAWLSFEVQPSPVSITKAPVEACVVLPTNNTVAPRVSEAKGL
ncbi:hypothetical protein FRB94_005169 [Tulasnella sp. JGI-2019a]|nr:hypothetical protein FRB93_004885 [Tulasnella sp. JGI-2019a]KAG9000789.1 hypothetical protein FRB94_005169 [Tulasnella sp. JGI-2019a]